MVSEGVWLLGPVPGLHIMAAEACGGEAICVTSRINWSFPFIPLSLYLHVLHIL